MTQTAETPAVRASATGVKGNDAIGSPKIAEAIQASKKSDKSCENVVPEPPRFLPESPSFKLGVDGIYKTEVRENEPPLDVWVFTPLLIEASTRDANSQNWGLLLAVQDPSGAWHRWAMPMQLIGGNGSVYREMLLSLGLRMAPGAQKHLQTYLSTARPTRMARCVDKVGWHNNAYVLADASFGQKDEEIFLQTVTQNLFKTSGTLTDWHQHLGRFCPGNSRLTFAACASLAAVLLKICDTDGGGFNFQGNSSIGKTTLLLMAGSVAGGGGQNGFLRSWRTTDNALETIALAHNDGMLCIDEMAQVDPKSAAESSYMLANRQGKSRSNKDGTARCVPEWRLLFLSSGEISLEQKLQEGGQTYMAGQAVRVIDIPADAELGHGIFENLYDFAGGKEFSEHIRKATAIYYGAPLRAFLAALTASLADSRAKAKAMVIEFETRLCPPQADGQVKRAAKRFALVAAAGTLAVEFGVFPWESETAYRAAHRCFQDWLAFRGGLGAAERREAIRRVRAFIGKHGASRFESWEHGASIVNNRAGFKRKTQGRTEYMFLRDAFEQEICLGANPKTIARYLLDAGYLVPDGQGNLTKTHTRSREEKSMRLYTVKGDILDSDE